MRLCKAKLNLFSSKVFIMKIKLTFVSGLEQSKVLGTRDWLKKMTLAQILAISKKSTIFAQSLWNLGKILVSWGNYFP